MVPARPLEVVHAAIKRPGAQSLPRDYRQVSERSGTSLRAGFLLFEVGLEYGVVGTVRAQRNQGRRPLLAWRPKSAARSVVVEAPRLVPSRSSSCLTRSPSCRQGQDAANNRGAPGANRPAHRRAGGSGHSANSMRTLIRSASRRSPLLLAPAVLDALRAPHTARPTLPRNYGSTAGGSRARTAIVDWTRCGALPDPGSAYCSDAHVVPAARYCREAVSRLPDVGRRRSAHSPDARSVIGSVRRDTSHPLRTVREPGVAPRLGKLDSVFHRRIVVFAGGLA